MTLQILNCLQGSSEWYRARLGLPTMSEAATILAKGRDGGTSLTRKKYLHRLAAEIVTEMPVETYSNGHMDRGKAQEDEARRMYAFMRDADPERVGFIRNGQKGCSPDALLRLDGLLEIKTRTPDLQIELLLQDRLPPEHRAQVQGNIWVAEREWCDLAVYSPGLPLFVCREYRDDGYIANLAGAVNRFNEELAEIVEKIRAYGGAPDLTGQLRRTIALLPEDMEPLAP